MLPRNAYPNRAAWRTAVSIDRRANRKRIDDLRERVDDDLTTHTIHPTKGFRHISGKRVEAQAKMPFFTMRWAQIAAVVR